MKFLTVALLSVISFSSFAESTVTCDIFKYEKNQNVTPVDNFLLGYVNGKFVRSVNRPVKGLDNAHVFAGLEKGDSISVTLIRGSDKIDENAEILIEAGVQGSGFQILNRDAEVAVKCGTYKNRINM